MNRVTEIPAAGSEVALQHFEAAFRYETDCWDVHEALARGAADFVLLDVRSPADYAAGHVAQARNVPHAKIISATLAGYAADTLFVVYCAGPHCNGAQRAAVRLARLGRAVKIMIGGMSGWREEGFEVVCSGAPAHVAGTMG
jgi:rhodanese-related sulfurtransferase